MKKIIPLLLFVLVGLFLVYFFVLRDQNASLPDFNVPQDQIGKIYIVDKHGNDVTLSLNHKNEWLVDSTYNIREEKKNDILYDLSHQRAISEVSESYLETVKKNLELDYKKVEVYNKKNKVLKVFYVGGPDPSNRGNYMALEGESKIYDVQIPEKFKNMTHDYIVDANDWRTMWIWDYPADDIKSVRIDYLDSTENSFIIQNNPPDYTIKGVPSINAPINTERASSYFNLFTKLPFEKVGTQWTDKAELMEDQFRISSVQLELKDGSIKRLDIFSFPEYYQGDKIEGTIDKQRVLVHNPEDDQVYVAQRLSFGRIFKYYREFFFR